MHASVVQPLSLSPSQAPDELAADFPAECKGLLATLAWAVPKPVPPGHIFNPFCWRGLEAVPPPEGKEGSQPVRLRNRTKALSPAKLSSFGNLTGSSIAVADLRADSARQRHIDRTLPVMCISPATN